jgi:hypothetical protein
MAKSWLTKEPKSLSPDDIIKIEHNYMPGDHQEKYIEKLKDKAFILLDDEEYRELFGKTSKKTYTIAFRSVSVIVEIPISKSYIYSNVYQIKGTTDLLVRERVYFEPDWRTLRLHRVVFVAEVNELPKNIYVLEGYGMGSAGAAWH